MLLLLLPRAARDQQQQLPQLLLIRPLQP